MISANLCLIATGKYRDFLPTAIATASRYFLVDFDVYYHVFTETGTIMGNRVFTHRWPHKPWPHGTLYRYHAMLSAEHTLRRADYTYYIDVDSQFFNYVNDEVIGDRVAVKHPGYIDAPVDKMPYERRPSSFACIPVGQGRRYHAGFFQGGKTETWLEDCRKMAAWIDLDVKSGIIPRWHDESIWNKYLTINKPTAVLDPGYCFPEEELTHCRWFPRIIALSKDHHQYRKE